MKADKISKVNCIREIVPIIFKNPAQGVVMIILCFKFFHIFFVSAKYQDKIKFIFLKSTMSHFLSFKTRMRMNISKIRK